MLRLTAIFAKPGFGAYCTDSLTQTMACVRTAATIAVIHHGTMFIEARMPPGARIRDGRQASAT